jgi:hypothetical protein
MKHIDTYCALASASSVFLGLCILLGMYNMCPRIANWCFCSKSWYLALIRRNYNSKRILKTCGYPQ